MIRFDTLFKNIQVFDTTIDFPNINSNQSAIIDVAVTLPQGTEIVSFAPLTDATSVDDLILQVFVPVANVLRFTAQNPSGGAINPDPVDFRIVTAEVNGDLAVTV